MKKGHWYQTTSIMLALILLSEPIIGIQRSAVALERDGTDGGIFFVEEIESSMDAQTPPLEEELTLQPRLRSIEELGTLSGITLTEDGQLAAVKASILEELSEEEKSILLSNLSSDVRVTQEADYNEELREQFGLTNEQIELGTHLHGSLLAFTSELGDLSINQTHMNISDGQMTELVDLVAAGYTCSQAISALASKTVLGLSLEMLKSARITACEEALLEAAVVPAEDDQSKSVLPYLAEKTGLPESLVEQLIESGEKTAYQIEQEVEGALMRTFPRLEVEASAGRDAVLASSEGQSLYLPKEVLGKPYAYDQQGGFDIDLRDGSYRYTETDLSIPGKNGLDLVLTRQYHSDMANTTSSFGAINPEQGYGYDIRGQIAFTLHYKWYEVTSDGTLRKELTNPSKYTLLIETDNLRAKRKYTFTLSNYDAALLLLDEERSHFCGWEYVAVDAEGNRYGVSIVPTITGTTDIVEKCMEIYEEEDSHMVDQFGLGQGWMMGISYLHREYPQVGDVNSETLQFRLTTSDGAQYYIEKDIGRSGNYIENYEGSDILFHRCASGEYPGAEYGLYHKDGTTEYFNADGRNIAIVDRFGNQITLAYTFSDSTNKRVTKIHITDTLNNSVVYEDLGLDADEMLYLKGRPYNGKWRLSLNGKTIREYYTYSYEYWLYTTPNRDGTETEHCSDVTQLVYVSNEAGELTRYNGFTKSTRFNCFLQPAVRSALKVEVPLYSNDGYNGIVYMYQVTPPNGTTITAGTEWSQKTFGDYGYRSYQRCTSVTPLDSAGLSKTTTQYTWGDFDLMDGKRGRNDDYCTNVLNSQVYIKLNPDGTKSKANAVYNNSQNKYKFNAGGQLIEVQTDRYNALPLRQEYIPEGYDWATTNLIPAPRKAEVTVYSYRSDTARKPQGIKTTYYKANGQAGMTVDQKYTYDDKYNILTYTKPNGQVEKYTYDSTYSLLKTKEIKQDASTTITVTNTLSADKKSIVSSVTTCGDAVVDKSVFRYNSAGQLIAEDDYLSSANFITTAYEYGGGALANQVSVSGVKTAAGTAAMGSPGFDAGTVVQKQTYNDRGWITNQTDANGESTGYQYDSVGRITKVTNQDGSIRTYSYDVPKGTVTYTDEAGSQWLCTYGKSGKLLTVTDLSSNKVLESYTYDHLDHLLKKVTYGDTTPDQTVYYRYDTEGRVIEQGNLDEDDNILYQELYEYQPGTGKVTKTVTGDNSAPSVVTTSYQDNMGNVIKTGRIYNGHEYLDTYSYDYVGNQIQAKSAYTAALGGSYTTKSTYDHAGRVLSTTNALGQTASKTYDWRGNQLTETDPAGNTAHYEYDVLGRLLRVQRPLDSGRTVKTEYSYDPNGNITSETVYGSTPRTSLYEYDALGRVTLAQEGAQYVQYTYDALGNVKKMYTGLHAPLTINSSGSVTTNGDTAYSVTSYTYDRYSRLTAQTDPLGTTARWTYDLNGALISATDRRGVVTNNTYDAMGRLTQSKAGSSALAFSYTSTNQRATAVSNGVETAYTYDSLGRLVEEELPYAVKSYSYNIGDLRTKFTVSDDTETYLNNTYTYDQMGRLQTVNGSGAGATYTYDANGNLSSAAYSNGTAASYAYNSGNLPTTVTNKRGSTTLSSYAYTYGVDGSQQTKTDHKGRKTTYTYDALNRLTREVQTGSGAFTNSYTYDDYGNRSKATLAGTAMTYSYNKANQLTQTSYTQKVQTANKLISPGITNTQISHRTQYTYDAQGNVTRELIQYKTGPEQGIKPPPGTEIMSAAEEMSASPGTWMTSSDTTYTYDGFNRLKKVSDTSGQTEYTYDADGLRTSKKTGSVTRRYVWDGDQLVVELASTAAKSTVYIRGLALVAAVTGETKTYYHYNAHGDVVQLTNTAGTVTKNYTYDAFGVEKSASASDTNPFRYCGEQYDGETGNYYLRARYYAPGVGRFIQEDPAMDGLNWYVYCAGNPIRFVDPSGLVLVGLRSYAETYDGATVTWDGTIRKASVSYNGKKLSVFADACNMMNNHIYVDDSLFVNAFGIGTKLLVYQDKKTKNISIRASFNYRGKDAFERMPGSENENAPWGISYSSLFLLGIEQYWSGSIGNYNISTYAQYNGDGIASSFKDKPGISNVRWRLLGGWSRSNPGKVTMYTSDSRSGIRYTKNQYQWGAAHEFGHLLGVYDAYESNNSTDITSIYNEFGTPVQPIDIEMVIKAWETGRTQYWP